ncbi:MAG TPA: transglutaminase family protein [Stellaceae bacterium]|nr:transglutaminase family protein [Stellaceae bacterium]
MLYSIHHRTTYRYSEPVSLSHHLAHLRPLDLAFQNCRMHSLSISPLPASIEEDSDYFGNGNVSFVIAQPHRELVIEAMSEVEMRPRERWDSLGILPWHEVSAEALAASSAEALSAAEFLFPSEDTAGSDLVTGFARESFPEGRPLTAAIADLSHRIHRDFTFDANATTIRTSPTEVLRLRRGVCQDFAHLAIACCRSVGLPARYVSGYLETLPPNGQPRLVGADASHAWLSVYAGGGRWIDIDPTNDRLADTSHIALGYGRDYDDVSPIKGVIHGGGNHSVTVGVDVERRLL